MSRQIKDLWPEEIASSVKEISPVTILRQQAALLGKKTKNLVEAEVETKTLDYHRFLQHTFYLVAPALDFYKYPLFQVEHYVTEWYPLEIHFPAKRLIPKSEHSLESTKLVLKKLQKSSVRADSEEGFLTELQRIFTDEQTVEAIQKLIAQSRS